MLFSDTGFAALPNATTLYAGQVIAPPAVWNGSTTPSLYVVTATGTTGTPNGGATTCVSTTTTYQLSCNSSTDLSAGQKITIGSVNTTIKYVDATNPSAVLVWTMNGVGTIGTPTALTFTAPLLSTQYSLVAGGSGNTTLAPSWLQTLGSGADGSLTPSNNASLAGEYLVTNFTLNSGVTVKVNAANGNAIIHATGTCTINGTILANGATSAWPNTNKGIGGGSSGGSGGGSSAGTAGITSLSNAMNGTTNGFLSGGTAGATSGGAGGIGGVMSTAYQRAMQFSGAALFDGFNLSGAAGVLGYNNSATQAYSGSGLVLICNQITGTGVIDVAGAPGNPPTANSMGGNSGAGGGVVILSSQNTVTSWPTIYTGGGAGGQTTVPYAVPAGTTSTASGNSCTTQPKLTLGVTSGALSSCIVTVAGTGCGSSPAINWTILGGGGSGGTVTPTWSGGAVASCTASGGSGYTAATYTTSGAGGDGGAGWSAEFQGW